MNKEIERIKKFIPITHSSIAITPEDEKMFIEYSSNGLHKDKVSLYDRNGFNALVQGKVWQGRQMAMWEEGILDGSIPYWTLLGGEDKGEIMSPDIVEFMSKQMFKGADRDIIYDVYKQIKYKWSPWYRKLWTKIVDLFRNQTT